MLVKKELSHVLLNKEKLSFREVSQEDAELLLQWRNDPVVRRNSFDQRIIEWEEHLAWLSQTLKDRLCHLYIILNIQGQKMGTVRFDEGGDWAEINITIANEFRGKGYGSQAIWQASSFFLATHPHLTKIAARIKEKNEQSLKAFIKANFEEYKREMGVVYLEFKL